MLPGCLPDKRLRVHAHVAHKLCVSGAGASLSNGLAIGCQCLGNAHVHMKLTEAQGREDAVHVGWLHVLKQARVVAQLYVVR